MAQENWAVSCKEIDRPDPIRKVEAGHLKQTYTSASVEMPEFWSFKH